MNDQSFNFEIKDLLTQFIAAFDDVVIKRYDKDRNPKETIEVRYVLAPKQRVMYDIVNKAQNLTLPVVAVNITGISRDNSRVFNKLDSIYNKTGDRSKSGLLMPVPINIDVSMSIISRYLQDMDQILSNFVPYNNPYIIISWKEPTNIDSQVVEIRSEVLWNGSISINEPTDLTYSEKFRVVADTTFIIKGWLFRNRNELSNQIYFIDTNFIPMRGDLIITDTDYDTFFSSLSDVTETVSISALPTITNAYYNTSGSLLEITSDFTLNKTITAYNAFVIYGTNFKYTDSILLSSSSQGSLTTTLTSISSKYTGGTTGYVLQSSYYSILNDNMISLDLSKLTGSGSFNIVVNNPVGWTSTYSINSFTFTKS
jgi:hypothetical protein